MMITQTSASKTSSPINLLAASFPRKRESSLSVIVSTEINLDARLRGHDDLGMYRAS
jgi:hypothetical protein